MSAAETLVVSPTESGTVDPLVLPTLPVPPPVEAAVSSPATPPEAATSVSLPRAMPRRPALPEAMPTTMTELLDPSAVVPEAAVLLPERVFKEEGS